MGVATAGIESCATGRHAFSNPRGWGLLFRFITSRVLSLLAGTPMRPGPSKGRHGRGAPGVETVPVWRGVERGGGSYRRRDSGERGALRGEDGGSDMKCRTGEICNPAVRYPDRCTWIVRYLALAP